MIWLKINVKLDSFQVKKVRGEKPIYKILNWPKFKLDNREMANGL